MQWLAAGLCSQLLHQVAARSHRQAKGADLYDQGIQRYAYYESRKDLARQGDPPATRIAQSALDEHLLQELTKRLED